MADIRCWIETRFPNRSSLPGRRGLSCSSEVAVFLLCSNKTDEPDEPRFCLINEMFLSEQQLKEDPNIVFEFKEATLGFLKFSSENPDFSWNPNYPHVGIKQNGHILRFTREKFTITPFGRLDVTTARFDTFEEALNHLKNHVVDTSF
jgi:hypothetical protein